MRNPILIVLLSTLLGGVRAQQLSLQSDSGYTSMPQIQVVLERNKLLSKVPGSVSVIGPITLKKIAPTSSNEVFRKVPGLNVVDEEGAGLRLNVGVRGLDPDRSRNVLMLEDGIPIALNPYGEPEMYFTPAIEKMSRIEVLKGSGQILFGPQTIGGVVNMITADPPEQSTSQLRIRTGSGGYLSTYASHGSTHGRIGYLVSYLNKRADNMGPTRFNLNDISTKLRMRLSDRSTLGIKLGAYLESSNATYIGLTQTMYEKGNEDFVRMAPFDFIPVRRYTISATHQLRINEELQWQNTLFAYTISRNWRRQDFSSVPVQNTTGIIWGDPTIADGAIYMLNTNGQRNRTFNVGGAESQLKWNRGAHQLHIGARLLLEQANEQFWIGSRPEEDLGFLRDDEKRSGRAASIYFNEGWQVAKKLNLHGGVRLEHYGFERTLFRGRFPSNGSISVIDTNLSATNRVTALIPGIGFNYSVREDVTFFGGLHRGFAPPRIKDAITSGGIPIELNAELSWNTEIGFRSNVNDALEVEMTFFRMDFSNQIIPVSQSSGILNATGLINGGKTVHQGMEWSISWDLGKWKNKKYNLIVSHNGTLSTSRYTADRFILVANNKVNVRNNRLPYAPTLMLNGALEWQDAKGNGVRFSGNYISEQFSDELNTLVPSNNGRIGLIASRYLIDASAFLKPFKKDIQFTVAVKNLTNERYIASRRPQGIRVGLPRQIFIGVEFRW
ncbi:MAG: TonB-dependent receptor family protein [Chitinophagaceae bacterium]